MRKIMFSKYHILFNTKENLNSLSNSLHNLLILLLIQHVKTTHGVEVFVFF